MTFRIVEGKIISHSSDVSLIPEFTFEELKGF
jgi:hypothetical protein